MDPLSPITLGFLGSLAAGSLTAVGAVPVLFGRIQSWATRDLLLGFGADGSSGGLSFAIGIGLQNTPEGLAVPVSLLGQGYSKFRAWGIAALTGLVEPVGAGNISLTQPLRPSEQGDGRPCDRPRDHVVPRSPVGISCCNR